MQVCSETSDVLDKHVCSETSDVLDKHVCSEMSNVLDKHVCSEMSDVLDKHVCSETSDVLGKHVCSEMSDVLTDSFSITHVYRTAQCKSESKRFATPCQFLLYCHHISRIKPDVELNFGVPRS